MAIKEDCLECGKSFITYPSALKRGQGFLCSRKCKSEWISKNYSGKNSKAGFRNALVELFCKNCGKQFKEYKSRIKEGRGIFCSKNCYSISCIGLKSNAWIDGRTFIKYPKDYYLIRGYVKQRDNFRCQNCGEMVEKKRLTVHHIDYNKLNNKEDNLITLCTWCNSQANGNKDKWLDIYRIKAYERMC